MVKNANEIQNNSVENVVSSDNLSETIYTAVDKKEWIFNDNDEYFIGYIENNYIGIYLPIIFIETLMDTKNFNYAMSLNHERNNMKSNDFYHDVLIAMNDRIYSNLGFYDGYAIIANEIQYYNFIENNQELFIIDNKGHQYKKLFDNTKFDNTKNVFKNIENYIGNIIFSDLIKSDKAIINENIITMLQFNRNFRIDLGWHVDDAHLILINENNEHLALKIENENYVFYKTIRMNPMEREIINEIEFEIQF